MKIYTKKGDTGETSLYGGEKISKALKNSMKKALLIINGEPPKEKIDISKFNGIFCTDGAYAKALEIGIQPEVIVGDLDSICLENLDSTIEVLRRSNQNFTDFHKSLVEIEKRGFQSVDVYGATGLEHDHFLGNLSTALKFKDKIRISFHDDFSVFFFAKNPVILHNTKNRIISLYPFPLAKNVVSEGLFYPLNKVDLQLNEFISTRNHSLEEEVKIQYDEGEMLVFVSKYQRDFS
ncbi:Thiamine pyrophosphokinase [Candidatus Ornithobacterium hominis]|uniref:Thiamine diphosphokinase n=1 Tax=Candidatus Ornithobacterium hominis TaxID=2497989 RepID=A0A383U0X1_9FLAO|nr:thiamine diphosphokinase [Candidatus Ornithobacterium hominis]MCT7904978.1 thiamine diphosphokinase [Candidatus Ornithobacterium hominis]SZD73485.1 Thiamine pyrophosphokinase [Candidatus Ornithobacterium hominis]